MMIVSIIIILSLIDIIIVSCNKRRENHENKIHIAFIFAGSGRSILFPTVYESINRNLIKSFCPPDVCLGDVYVRVSHRDNVHEGPSSKGTFVEGNRIHRDHVLSSIQSLKHSYNGKVIVDECDIGSMAEKDDIEEEIKGTFRTKFYYQLDSRRFNMYFNRWKSYSMMLKNEVIMNISYSWVVHARLDMAWGTPVKPYYYWTKRVWVPDSWYADVPDTFALIPRSLSNGYFSLKDMYEPNDVSCLGGPNFNPNTTLPDNLSKLGYNNDQIHLIIADLCITKNTADGLNIVDQNTGILWNTAGNSEVQLKRKLRKLGIEYDRNNGLLGFYPFFTFWVRIPYHFICMYLDPLFLIPWVKEFQKANSAMLLGCQFMMESMPCDINSLYDINRIKVKTHVGKLKCRDDVIPHDWNFMPYRISSKNFLSSSTLCLTHNYTILKSSKTYADMKPCVDNMRIQKEWDSFYSPPQLFHLYPLLKAPQKIIIFNDDGDNRKKCLTYGKMLDTFLKHNESVFHFDKCSNSNVPDSNQLFRVELLNHHNSDNYNVNANNSIIHKTLIRLRLTGQYGSCVSIDDRIDKNKILTPMILIDNCESDKTILVLDQTKTF